MSFMIDKGQGLDGKLRYSSKVLRYLEAQDSTMVSRFASPSVGKGNLVLKCGSGKNGKFDKVRLKKKT